MTATQAPTPGPLDSESVKLLVKGDLLLGTTHGLNRGEVRVFEGAVIDAREAGAIHYSAPIGGGTAHVSHFAFIGRPIDADGWIEHDGSDRNPLPGATVDARGSKFVLEPTARPSEEIKWDRVRMWRLSASRLAPAAPVEASGSERALQDAVDFGVGFLVDGQRVSPERVTVCHGDSSPLRPQPSGETREQAMSVERIKGWLERNPQGGAEPIHPDDLRALLSARPLALGGQQGEDAAWFEANYYPPTTTALAEAQDEGAATDDLVDQFAVALKAKLRAAGEKYGFDDAWKADDWRDKLIEDLLRHVQKGDPRDVAAYCAFAWHHDWSLSPKQDDLRSAAFTDRGAEDRYVSQNETAAGKPVAWFGGEDYEPTEAMIEAGLDHNHRHNSEANMVASFKSMMVQAEIDGLINPAHPSPTPAADADRVRKLETVADLADELINRGGLVNRGVDRGLVVVEKTDRSDAHYRLCLALEALKSTAAKEGGES